MTTGVPARPTAPARGTLERRRVRRRVMRSVVRTAVVTGTMVAVYVTAPLDRRPAGAIAVRLLLELLALVLVLAWQIRSVSRSPHPVLRGVESLVVSVPLLVLSFAATYSVVDHNSPGSFTEDLSRLDAAYLAVTILSTVGFGDITPVTDVARSLVMSQMLVDLAFVGLVAKVLVGAVRRRRDEMQSVAATSGVGEVDTD
jgi:voltage-gated potassium channel